MAHSTLRQAIQTWQQRFDLTGMALVETSLASRPMRADCSIDATLAQLARVTPVQFAVELRYPWGNGDGHGGALLGLLPESCELGCTPDAALAVEAA